MSDVEELTTYYAENDGWGIVGYSFECPYCGHENRFVDEEESVQECGECGEVVRCKPITYSGKLV